MLERVKVLGICFIPLVILLCLILFTIQYTVHVYSTNRLQSQEAINQLQNQLVYLGKQLDKPTQPSNAQLLQEYKQRYDVDLQTELGQVTMFQPAHLADKQTDLLQALIVNKNNQLEKTRNQSFFSYIPEWPILILALLGIVFTNFTNFLVDYFGTERLRGWLEKNKKIY